MENYVRNIKLFNSVKGKSFRFNNERIKNKYQYLVENKFNNDESLIVKYFLAETTSSDLHVALNKWSVDRYLEQQQQQPQLQQKPKEEEIQMTSNKSSSELTLGLIEQALAQVIADKYIPSIATDAKVYVDEYVKNTYGSITKQITFQYDNRKLEETTHDEFDTVFQFVLANEPVMLVGPAGSGKNHIVKQVAKLSNLNFYFTNAVTQEYKLTGFIDAMGTYHETEFYKAFKNGGIFMLDEIDASIPEVLVILNAAIANRYFDFPNGKIDAHSDFRIIAAGNTYGQGASLQYVGRNQLDGASLNRFAIVEIGYSPAIENFMTNNVELLEFYRQFRKGVELSGINHIVSYRELSRLDKMLQSSLDTTKVLRTCLTKNLEKEDLRTISEYISKSNKYNSALMNLMGAL